MTEEEFRSSAESWDHRYSQSDRVWSGRANPVLREVAASLEPGLALDVGCGEGGDVVWLAEHGWSVVGLDLSSVALERAAAAAAELGVGERCTWLAGDVTDETLSAGIGKDRSFDLVTSHYLHEPSRVRTAAWLAAADLTAPGGILLIVGHHPDDESPTGRGPRDPSVLFTPEEVTEALASAGGLDVETSEMRERSVVGSDGPSTRRDTVVVARRRSEIPAVLFVCVHNAGRSQMAAGWLQALGSGRVRVLSAGSMPADQINAVAVEAMAEVGIDIARQQPKVLTDGAVQESDVVITMGCGDACQIYPGKRYEDWKLEDPAGQGVEAVRVIRDEIRGLVEELLVSLGLAPALDIARTFDAT